MVMKRFRDPSWTLIILFVGILAAVPLIQTFKELTQEGGEGVVAFEVFNQLPSAANLRAYEKKMEAGSWAAKASRPWLQFTHFKWLKDGGDKVVEGSSGWYFYKPGLNYMLARPHHAKASKAKDDPVGAIVHFRDQLAAHGIHLLVMPVPNKESVYPDHLTSRAGNLRGIVTPRTREILEQLQSRGVQTVDLFKEFGEARQKGAGSEAPLYLSQDTHWSPLGMSLAAKAAARRLMELGWAGPGNVEYSERPAPVERLGDLVRMLQSPMIERATKPENVSCAQVMRARDNQPYQDEIGAQILVLGDSFLRIYQQDAPTSAGFIAHLAKELKQPMMSLVNDGGGSTLVRQELSARPIFLENKKVVLWEFVERDFGVGVKGWQQITLPPPSQ